MFSKKELVIFFDALDRMGDQTFYKFEDNQEIFVMDLMVKVKEEVMRLEEVETP